MVDAVAGSEVSVLSEVVEGERETANAETGVVLWMAKTSAETMR